MENPTIGGDTLRVIACLHYGMNPRFLGITGYALAKALKGSKEAGYTEMRGYGGSGCVCRFNESVNWCECGGAPFVGRRTGLSEKGRAFAESMLADGTLPSEAALRAEIGERNMVAMRNCLIASKKRIAEKDGAEAKRGAKKTKPSRK